MSARSHRRWFQFSVRGMLLLTTAVAIALGFWVSAFHRRHQALVALDVARFRHPRKIRYAENKAARWLGRQKWLSGLLGEHFFDDPFEISLTGAHGSTGSTGGLNDADARPLEHLGPLQRLSLDWTATGDEGMQYLRLLRNLEYLNVAQSSAGDAALESMATLSKLQQLNLSRTRVTDAGLRHLSKLTALTHLELRHTEISDQGITALKDLHQLVLLDVSETKMGDAGLAVMHDFNRLERLLLAESPITGRGFAATDDLPALRELDLSRTLLTDEGLLALPAAPSLKRLLLNETAVTDEGLKRLVKFTALETLELRGTKITGRALAFVQKLPRLSYLNLCDTQIDDSDIDALNEICSLASVALIGTRVTELGLMRLQVAGSLASEPVDARTMARLAEPTELDFQRQPFTDVLDYLKQRHDVEIQVDRRLQQEKSFLKLRVTGNCFGLPLLQALQELLAPQRWVLVYRHGVLQVMPRPVSAALCVPMLKVGEVLSPRLESVLSQKTELDFADHPFAEVVDWLVYRHKIDIHLDEDAFRNARPPDDTPITRSIKGITLRSALGLLLEPLDLVCVAEGDTLVIRPGPLRR